MTVAAAPPLDTRKGRAQEAATLVLLSARRPPFCGQGLFLLATPLRRSILSIRFWFRFSFSPLVPNPRTGGGATSGAEGDRRNERRATREVARFLSLARQLPRTPARLLAPNVKDPNFLALRSDS